MGLPVECMKYFAKMIEDETGIVYSEVNHYQLEGRLQDIAKHLGFNDALELWERSKTAGLTGPMKLLATNNETSFFRDMNIFQAIGKIVENAVPLLKGRPLRVWSAACSTGQELYSLAIQLTEQSKKLSFTYSIFATDISDRVLKRAEAGVYSQLEVQRGLSTAQLITHFTHDGDRNDNVKSWTVRSEMKGGLSFRKLNLLEPWGSIGRFDLILCRNVLIYQTVQNKKKVVDKLAEHLEEGGHLVLGGAESLIGISERLVYTRMDNAVVYKKVSDRKGSLAS